MRMRRALRVLRTAYPPAPHRGLSGSVVKLDTQTQQRKAELERMQAERPGWSPYPSAPFAPSMGIREYVAKFGAPGMIANGSVSRDSQEVGLTGRLASRRDAGKKLLFLDLVEHSTGARVQVKVEQAEYKGQEQGREQGQGQPEGESGASLAFREAVSLLRRGDLVGVRGLPCRTKTGELSVLARSVVLLAPCVQPLPLVRAEEGGVDQDLLSRRPYLNLLLHPRAMWVAQTRSRVVSALRSFLLERGFMEVETPILWSQAGGASAKPFVTSGRAFGEDMPLFLRIAPELFLKQLVIGGMERVFEIGRVFRNEGVDSTHHPEFTTCEFYQAHASYRDLMVTTEELVRKLVAAATGGKHAFHCYVKGREEEGEEGRVEVDVSAPFRVIDIVPALEEAIEGKLPLPPPGAANDPDIAAALLQIAAQHGINVQPPHTAAHIIDKLIGHFLEPRCVQPTFLINHPSCMSPLARAHPSNPLIAQRFELFMGGQEICNAYSEQNQPAEQRRQMQAQAGARELGDAEAAPPDESFCMALEYGLPPTAGWGMGIDRLVQLITASRHIRNVLLFTLSRPQQHQQQQQAATGPGPGPGTKPDTARHDKAI